MRRSWVIGMLAFLLAFLGIYWSRLEPSQEAKGPSTTHLDSSLRNDLTRFWSDFQRATRLRTAGDFRQAAEAYQAALSLDPHHPESLYYLGNCHFELGEYSEARRLYERLLELQPTSARTLSRLGILLSSPLPGNELDFMRARWAFQEVARINPEQSGPFLRLGGLALQEGDLNQALSFFETAAGFRSPEGIFLSGMVLYRLGRLDEAISKFEEVQEIGSREGQISSSGSTSEGDLLKAVGPRRFSPIQATVLKSQVLMAWIKTAQEDLGGSDRADPEAGSRENLQKRIQLVVPIEGEGTALGTWQRFGGESALVKRALNSKKSVLPTGLEFTGTPIATAIGDYNGDSLDDVYLLRWKEPGILWKNLGNGHYQNDTEAAGLSQVGGTGLSVLFFDYDQDQDPDLLLTSQVDEAVALQHWLDPNLVMEEGTPRLFRNEGGLFREVTALVNLNHPHSTLQAFAVDFNRDSWLDLVLINGALAPEPLIPSAILLNRQGRFEEYAWIPIPPRANPAAAAAVADFDADGQVEIFLVGRGLFRVL